MPDDQPRAGPHRPIAAGIGCMVITLICAGIPLMRILPWHVALGITAVIALVAAMLGATKGMGYGSEAVEEFRSECPKIFDPMLLPRGFERVGFRWNGKSQFETLTYRNGDLYIEVGITVHYRDAPEHCSLELGEGSFVDPIEWDWNSAPLMVLVPVSARDADRTFGYELQPNGGVVNTLRLIREHLELYASDFLDGETQRFREMRAALNRQREPYRVYGPGPLRKSEIEFLEKAEQARKKYSE